MERLEGLVIGAVLFAAAGLGLTRGPSFYRTAEGTWHLLDSNNQPLMLRLHIPAGK